MAKLTAALLLKAYSAGMFPMADPEMPDEIAWFDPPRRGILPLDNFHVSRSLQKKIRQGTFNITVNRCFSQVMQGCADETPSRKTTWINKTIIENYTELHRLGHAHSVEAWAGETLAGGLYGVAIGAAFFGESMFSRATDASKAALVHLAARLSYQGYQLLDTQYVNEHLLQFGCIEIPRRDYHARLHAALQKKAQFALGDDPSETELVTGFLHSLSHKS